MMGNVAYGLLFLLTMLLQTAAIPSLPPPLRLFPLALVIGVVVLHERSLLLGVLWIALAGVILEVRGLGEGLAVAAIVAAGSALALAIFVFAKRSFWALMGVGAGTVLAYVLARVIWLSIIAAFTERSLHVAELFQQGLLTVIVAVIGVFIFGAYIRRFLRWSRDKFVSKGQLYEISFPQ